MGVESGGTGGRIPRSLKISGGRPPRNYDISVFFRKWEYPSTVANLEAIFGSISNKLPPRLSKLNFECRKINFPIRVRKINSAR